MRWEGTESDSDERPRRMGKGKVRQYSLRLKGWSKVRWNETRCGSGGTWNNNTSPLSPEPPALIILPSASPCTVLGSSWGEPRFPWGVGGLVRAVWCVCVAVLERKRVGRKWGRRQEKTKDRRQESKNRREKKTEEKKGEDGSPNILSWSHKILHTCDWLICFIAKS